MNVKPVKSGKGDFYCNLHCSLENNSDIGVFVGVLIWDDGYEIFINPKSSIDGKFFEYGVLIHSIQVCEIYILKFLDALRDDNHNAFTVVNGLKIKHLTADIFECIGDGDFIKVN